MVLEEGRGRHKGRQVIREVLCPGADELAKKHMLFKGIVSMENNRNVPDAMRRAYAAWKKDQEFAAAAAREAAEKTAQAPEEEVREQAS